MSKVKFLVAVMLSVLVAACSEEENLSQAGKTGFHVSLTEDVKVDSRSTPEELGEPLASQFNLKITNQATGNTVHDALFKGKEGETEFIPAAAGTYDFEATYGENPVLALDDPYYKGTAEDVVLEDGKQETVKIECEVANALASVVFSDEGAFKFADQFEKGYGVEVWVSGNSVTLDDKKSAYYRAGSTPTFIFKGTTKNGGEEVSFTLSDPKFEEAKAFAAKAHCVITLKIAAVVPGVRVEISKVEVDSVTVSGTIPMEWLPKPKVTAEGFDESNTLTFVETEQKQAALNLNLSSALQDMKFKFNFQDEQFATLDKEKTYLLSVPEEKAAIEEALGITLPNVGDKPESIDLSKLLAKLQTNAGVATSNTIEIDVQANNRWSSEAKEDEEAPNLKYTLTCNKPEFSIAVQPENCWAWEFSADEVSVTTGNPEKIKNNLVYQYYDGANWVNFNNGYTQRFVKDENRKYVYLTDNPESRIYRVRALYRGEIPSDEVSATLEEPWQLPNSGMEEWYYENVAREIYTYYPWKENTESYWGTNNPFTTRYKSSTGMFTGSYTYNCFPAVSYVVGGHSGKRAVELRSTASGQGNTIYPWGDYNFSNVRTVNKVAGELFTGDFEVTSTDGYEIKTEGRPFLTRPTALHFWYKYNPTNTDTWRAKIVLMDADHNVIIENELTQSEKKTQWDKAIVSLDYEDDEAYAKCQYIFVLFSSTINAGDSMPYESLRSYVLWRDESQITHSDSRCAIGSVLTIDDISLVYDK